MTIREDIPKDAGITGDATNSTIAEPQIPNPSDRAGTSPGQSSAVEGSIRRPVTITPPRDPELEGSWEQSPLDIAIRRRLFFRSKSKKGAASEIFGKRKLSPTEAQSRTSAADTLRQSDSLEIADGKDGEPRAKAEPDSPTSTQVDGQLSGQQPSTPVINTKGKFPIFKAEKVEQEEPHTPRQSNEAKPPRNFVCPRVDAVDLRRALSNLNLFIQRIVFGSIVLAMNIACLVAALKSERHLWVLIIILLVKAKDIFSTFIQVGWLAFSCFWRRKKKQQPRISGKWILTCITAFEETEEQIMRTINSVINNAPQKHHMAMVIMVDGRPQKILRHFTEVNQIIHRPYRTWRHAHNEVNIYTGLIKGMPIIMFEKIANAGKKDSLILCHDLFNHMRENVPDPTKEMRAEVWTKLLPQIIRMDMPQKFDFLFFTDVDSMIYEDTLNHLAQALSEEPDSIAACGLVLAAMMPGNTWSMWYLYQQFQVRRSTDHTTSASLLILL